MPHRVLISEELAKLFGVLSHPHRVRIIEELRDRELDVNALQELLGVSHSRVSQSLAVLRSYRLVAERREGRHVYYRSRQPELARWILQGLDFLEGEAKEAEQLRAAVAKTRRTWAFPPKSQAARSR